MLFANVCARFISSCYGECFLAFLGALWFLLGVLCTWSTSFAGLPVVYKTWVILVCILLDTPFGRKSVGALPR